MVTLAVKKGLSSPAVTSIPQDWDRQWFRYFIDNFLSGADIRNISPNSGITVSGNVSGNSTTGTPSNSVVVSLTPIPSNTVLGNVSGISATPIGITKTQLTTLINQFTSALPGDVPASGGGTVNFLRADGAWAAPPTALPANPTALVGPAAVNGIAATFMRSDAAPAINLTATFPWTGTHTFLTHPIGITSGGTGTATPALVAGTGIALTGTWPNNTITLTTPVAIANGGTGSTAPSLVAGTGISISGSWPNQTITSSVVAPTGANPTASVGLSAVNGVAATFMRSDAAPALSQSITPSWSGLHIFTSGLTVSGSTFASRGIQDNGLSNAITIANTQAISTTAPTAGNVALTVNGAATAVVASFVSGNSSVTAGADLRVQRAGSTINQAGQGPNVFINDTTNLAGWYLQSSGQQFELWSSSGAGPTLTQILKVLSTGTFVHNTPTSGETLQLNNNLGAFSATGNPFVTIKNSNASAQTPIDFFSNGTFSGRIRNDSAGNMSYVSLSSGNHDFFVGGDSGVGVLSFEIRSGKINLANHATTTTAPAAGGAGALPATPKGYVTIQILGADQKLAYY